MNIPNWYNELSGRPLAGRRNAGQLGNADTTFWGRKILRMNTKYQIIYVLGTCAGDVGTYGRIYDSRTTKNELGPFLSSKFNNKSYYFLQPHLKLTVSEGIPTAWG